MVCRKIVKKRLETIVLFDKYGGDITRETFKTVCYEIYKKGGVDNLRKILKILKIKEDF